MNKKAMIMEPALVLVVIIVFSLISTLVLINQGTTATIGQSTSNLIELDREIKLKLDLIEQAALYHIYDSIIELNENGGFSKTQKKQDCKWWSDYKLYEECILTKDKIRHNLKLYLFDSFNAYAKENNLNPYSIDISQEKNKLIVTFTSPNINFKKDNVEFTTTHSFKKEVNYDLEKISELYKKFHNKLLEKCPNTEADLAIDEELEVPNLKCEAQEFILEFEYPQEKFYLNNNPNSFEYPKIPVLKFRLSKVIKQ